MKRERENRKNRVTKIAVERCRKPETAMTQDSKERQRNYVTTTNTEGPLASEKADTLRRIQGASPYTKCRAMNVSSRTCVVKFLLPNFVLLNSPRVIRCQIRGRAQSYYKGKHSKRLKPSLEPTAHSRRLGVRSARTADSSHAESESEQELGTDTCLEVILSLGFVEVQLIFQTWYDSCIDSTLKHSEKLLAREESHQNIVRFRNDAYAERARCNKVSSPPLQHTRSNRHRLTTCIWKFLHTALSHCKSIFLFTAP